MQKELLYIFSYYSYDSIHIQKIIAADDDEECIEKILSNYDEFDDMIKENLVNEWGYGGLFENLKFKNQWTHEYWLNEEIEKIKNDMDYRRKLVEEYKDTILAWLPAFYKCPENCGCIDVSIYDTNKIIY